MQFLHYSEEEGQHRNEPDTMSAFSRSIQRYLDDNSAKINILKDKDSKSQEKSFNPRVKNSGSRAKKTNQTPQ